MDPTFTTDGQGGIPARNGSNGASTTTRRRKPAAAASPQREPAAPRRPRKPRSDAPAAMDTAGGGAGAPAATEEPGVGAPGGAPKAQASRARIPAIAAAAIIVILAAAASYFGLRVSDQNSTESLRSSALSTATTYGAYLSSYSYQNLTSPTSAWSEVESHATAGFRKDFQSTSTQLAAVLHQYKATSQGKVIAAGISSLSSSRAVVLLFIDQTVTNTVQKPNTTTQPLRVELTLSRQGGRWLIDNLQVPK